MPAVFEIKINPAQLAQLKIVTAGIKNGMPRALSQGINRTLNGARTEMVQQAYDTYNLTKKRIREDFNIKYASIGGITGNVFGNVRMSGTAIRFVEGISGGAAGTFNFGATALRKGGVRAKVRRATGFETWPNAFFAIMPNGHAGFFQREHRALHATGRTTYHGVAATKIPWKRIYPARQAPQREITELSGPAAESAFSYRQYPTAMPTVEKKIQARMDKALGERIDFELSKF